MELKIEYVDIDTLKPYENNARSHGKDDVKAIVKSITDFGFNDPIGVWHDEIVEGHGRLMAAKELGMSEVPIIRLDELTDEQRRAYMLAHNKTAELSGWNFDILDAELADISEFDMSQYGFDIDALGAPAEVVEDDYDFKDTVEHRASEGDLFQLGNHRLMCGDSSSSDDLDKLSGGCEQGWSLPIRRMVSRSETRTRCCSPSSGLDGRPRTSSGTLWVLRNCTTY